MFGAATVCDVDLRLSGETRPLLRGQEGWVLRTALKAFGPSVTVSTPS